MCGCLRSRTTASQVVIVDESTGRLSENRRWQEKIHQSLEAREGVEIKGETATLATTTYQRFFEVCYSTHLLTGVRSCADPTTPVANADCFSVGDVCCLQEFDCLSGMTGTAKTEAEELWLMYNLTVVTVPQNRPNIRKDWDTDFFITEELKLQAILDEVVACYHDFRPILVGTTSIKESEKVARMLARWVGINTRLIAKFDQLLRRNNSAMPELCCAYCMMPARY